MGSEQTDETNVRMPNPQLGQAAVDGAWMGTLRGDGNFSLLTQGCHALLMNILAVFHITGMLPLYLNSQGPGFPGVSGDIAFQQGDFENNLKSLILPSS